jgi:ketosteroid isomerase-like protein
MTSPSSDEKRIHDLIVEWTNAIGAGDRKRILAHHADNLLMFDLPAPIVRGLGAYNRTWDFFFANPQGKITYTPRDIEVTAGDDVAFASFLVRCEGTSAGPVDVRLTFGFRKKGGDWVIMHEHHSVPSEEERFQPAA